MNLEQCKGCSYFRALGWAGNGGFKACHYLLYTGDMRRRDGDNCFERTTGKIHTKVRPFSGEPSGKSVYSGYKVYGRETWV